MCYNVHIRDNFERSDVIYGLGNPSEDPETNKKEWRDFKTMDKRITLTLAMLLMAMSMLLLFINNRRVDAVNQVNDLQAQTQELNDDIATMTDAIAEYTVTIEEYENEIATLNDALAESQEEVETLKEELTTEEDEEVEVYDSDEDATYYELDDDPISDPINDETVIPDEPAVLKDNDTAAEDEDTDEVIIDSITKNGETVIPEYYKDVTDDDIYWIQRVVETETYGADMISKSHVASVVLNRIGAKSWGETAKDVVTSPNQFVYFRTTISQSTIDAVDYVLENGDTAQGALYFHSGGYTSTFCGRSCIFGDDVGHYFY